MARRLVEAGVELVTATLNGPLCGRVNNWDDHAVNHHVFDAMKARAPYFDQAVAALITDLHERGLAKKVLLIVGGDFGRTPRISYAADSALARCSQGATIGRVPCLSCSVAATLRRGKSFGAPIDVASRSSSGE